MIPSNEIQACLSCDRVKACINIEFDPSWRGRCPRVPFWIVVWSFWFRKFESTQNFAFSINWRCFFYETELEVLCLPQASKNEDNFLENNRNRDGALANPKHIIIPMVLDSPEQQHQFNFDVFVGAIKKNKNPTGSCISEGWIFREVFLLMKNGHTTGREKKSSGRFHD